MIYEIFAILVVVSAIPLGYLVAYMARDELIVGRKWFGVLMILSLVLFFLCLAFRNYPSAFTLAFIFIATWVSLVKSKDKKFISKKI